MILVEFVKLFVSSDVKRLIDTGNIVGEEKQVEVSKKTGKGVDITANVVSK